MSSSADFACSGGCGAIPMSGSPAILFTVVQNGTSIQLQGMSDVLLAPNTAYLAEYNVQFSTPTVGFALSSELTLNGSLIPGSQTLSFPSTIPPGLNTPVSSVSGGAVFNTPSTPNPSVLQLVGFPPSGVAGANYSSVNLRIVEVDPSNGGSVTNNNAGIYGYGYVDVGFDEPIPFLEAEVTNGTGINFSSNTPTSISLAPNATYFVSYNFIACPLIVGLAVRVILSLNNVFLNQSLSLAPALTDLSTIFTSAAGSAVFNTGADPNQILELINNTNTMTKFVSANINIVQIG
ncbi:hypothetical protein C7Y47_00325 [Lysinibacillus sphaericus]|uniref:Uncharacterized protein n=1 Tax=Lysinibacillus sphaericus TaxID=1421 RepID=A0A544V0A0_LYSSH|nr:hypothetical protein [Lysinibacillus sp. SDF0037]TQR39528.1 hypothetical protein C7Y47_00325 [Lysinibacillus sp. SDF0037]